MDPWGAEIVDLDLSVPMVPEVAEELRSLFREFDLILARDQRLTLDQQFAVMDHLGPTLRDRDFTDVSTEANLGTTALPFHSDGAFNPVPLRAISLYAVDVIEGASSTRFASGARTLQLLPAALREALSAHESLHVLPLHVDRRNRATDVPDSFPRAHHPVIVSDPDSGREAVFLCDEMLDGIVGIPVEESDDLIEAVFAIHHADDNVVEHRWSVGDIVIWNNLLVQHGRGDMASVGRRRLQRASVGTHGPMDFAGDLDLTPYPTATGQ